MAKLSIWGLCGGAIYALCALNGASAQPKDHNEAHADSSQGEALYRQICQDCHMSHGEGAVGAGAYPRLANNQKLAERGYPVAVVVNGQKAMPSFGAILNDNQVADVVNFVRTHFGNKFSDKVTTGDVKAARP